MYVTTKEILQRACEGQYAVGAFNVENAEMVWAVIAAAEELRAPVILQTTPSTLRYLSPAYFVGMVRWAGNAAGVPVAMHLDHGSSYELAETCIAEGYTSVMIDGSALPFEENIALSQKVCRMAWNFGVSVEAELGVVGGKEDDTEAEGVRYTEPEEAADFAARTGVDSLAVAIGTAHGFYAVEPKLDLERITRIRKMVKVPLVLHGASGLPDDTVRRAVSLGMAKINFATELRETYSKAIREQLKSDPTIIDPKKFGTSARQAVQDLVMHKIRLCGCDGKA